MHVKQLSTLVLIMKLKSYGLTMLVQVLHAFAAEGAHCSKVRDILSASDVSLKTYFYFSLNLRLFSA